MSLISLLVFLLVFAVILYVVQLLPVDGTIKRIIQIVLVLIAILYLLDALGVISGLGRLRL
jgi:hypothetical protein